jgi:hypothetical protein
MLKDAEIGAQPANRALKVRCRRTAMKCLAIACLALLGVVAPVQAGTVTVNKFSSDSVATISFNDGSGEMSASYLLAQINVTYNAVPGQGSTFNTFSIDLTHSVSVGQTYAVNARPDLATAFSNGSRIAYIFQNFGLQNLTGTPDQAAAVQVALWDLSLNNHNPTSFGPAGDGTYNSGDPSVFSVNFGSNPDASQIASLANQYLKDSIDATTRGGWLDATGSGSSRGQSLLSVPEPSSICLGAIAAGWLGAWGLRQMRRPGRAHSPGVGV